MNNKLFLYSNVMVIKGFSNSLIYDFFNQEVHSIQHEFLEKIEHSGLEIHEENGCYFHLNNDVNDLILYLESNNLAYISEKRIISQSINEDYESPYLIENIILTFKGNIDVLKLEQNLYSLIDFTPSHISCFFLESIKDEILNEILNLLSKFLKSSISLNFKVNPNIDLIKIINLNNKIIQINIYGENEVFIDSYRGTILQSIGSPKKMVLHEPNIYFYKESLMRNTFFNKTLWVNENGDFSNQNNGSLFGNVTDLSFSEFIKVIKSNLFQEKWFVRKDIIDICKDCEFRHLCVDSRIPRERRKNEWFHDIECNYNPYIAKWKGEEGYKNLNECDVVSNENVYFINQDKINKINQEIW